jgi:hypothetical protein
MKIIGEVLMAHEAHDHRTTARRTSRESIARRTPEYPGGRKPPRGPRRMQLAQCSVRGDQILRSVAAPRASSSSGRRWLGESTG